MNLNGLSPETVMLTSAITIRIAFEFSHSLPHQRAASSIQATMRNLISGLRCIRLSDHYQITKLHLFFASINVETSAVCLGLSSISLSLFARRGSNDQVDRGRAEH